MKYVLVDIGDNIIDKVDLASGIGVQGAKTFFVGRKQIDKKEFDNLWKVMTKEQYDIQFKATLQNKQYEWWKDIGESGDLDDIKI